MKKEFKAESKRLLDLVVNSIYTNKEIFLRELLSNASDATDKRYYRTLAQGSEALNRTDLPIELSVDKEKRTITITDHGCGMSEEELEENLGTIAHSGSLDFKEQLKEQGTPQGDEQENVEIIGQFGVGFYSAFMVADRVEVFTKGMDEEQGYLWESQGIDTYTVRPYDKEEIGTQIVLHLKDNDEDESYDDYLEDYRLSSLVSKHSDYIRYPIRMEMEKSRPVEGEEGEFETYHQVETLNSMTPIWKRRQQDVEQEEYFAFYRSKFGDFNDPMRVIRSSSEGLVSYQSLLFIPSHAPFNYYSPDFQKGLQLYANGVLIMDKCEDLLPDYFGFVKGLVDSQDLSLNISREMLQQDRQLHVIANHLEKKIQSELEDMLQNSREDYENFFQHFGISLKLGVYDNFGMHKEKLEDLLLYHSSAGADMTTLAEYVSRMPEEQKYIYYACGDSIAQLEKLPAAEVVLDKGFEILYMTQDVDEFCARILESYDGKELRSLADGDLGLETEEEKEKLEEKSQQSQDLFAFMKEALDGKVEEVKFSTRLKNHPVCMGTKGEITLEMEKMFAAMPDNPGIRAERVLELNAEHEMFSELNRLYQQDQDKLALYSELLYGQALLLEGLELDDPIAFSDAVAKLMLPQQD